MNQKTPRSRGALHKSAMTRSRVGFVLVLTTAGIAILSTVMPASATNIKIINSAPALRQTIAPVKPIARATSTSSFPTGSLDTNEPSGEAPPQANALPGYTLTYENDFTGSKLPSGWDVYAGSPGNDPGGVWASSHVVVGNGLLQLNAFEDPAYNNEWATGGLCQCGVAHVYGAYFVRSRMTGAGPTQDELLWPTGAWPPEIDFNETFGGDSSTMATVHFTSANTEDQRTLDIDMTQWHTWGVIWTPSSITYTVDGKAWGTVSVASEIPNQPMTLDIQQQTFCASGWACPTTPESTDIDWVAEYAAAIQYKVTVAPFAVNSSVLSPGLKRQVRALATSIKSKGYTAVTLLGFSNNSTTPAKDVVASRKRAIAVKAYLLQQLASLQVSGVRISAVGNGNVEPAGINPTPSGSTSYQSVVALIS